MRVDNVWTHMIMSEQMDDDIVNLNLNLINICDFNGS